MFRFVVMVLCLAGSVMLSAPGSRAAEVVRVGGYDFPPFVEVNPDGVKGLTLDLIEAMNQAQSAYEFRFISTSARRRYSDLAEGRFDLIFFESPEWEWSERKAAVDFSDVFLTGGELYIAPAAPGRGQAWFDVLQGRKLVGILGYHYGFAGFEADPEVLGRKWGMKLVSSQRSAIEMVLAGRMDIGVVTDSYLWSYLKGNPGNRERLLISQRYDQHYNHRILVRQGAPISVTAVNSLLTRMKQEGTLDRLWRTAGIIE